MTRTIGTIMTSRGLAQLLHDDADKTLSAYYHDGGHDTQEGEFEAWADAYSYAEFAWGNRGYHDEWVLCLRPKSALRTCKFEDKHTGGTT